MLDSLITSKTRVKLLVKFFSNSKTKSYLRSLAEEFGESSNALRLELNNLSNAGYLVSEESGRIIQYRANVNHPFFSELQNVVLKYLGLDSLVENIIKKLGNVQFAFITGDYAKGRDTGIIDLVIIGEVNNELLEKLIKKVEVLIKRKIRGLVLTLDEYSKLKSTLNSDDAIWLWKMR